MLPSVSDLCSKDVGRTEETLLSACAELSTATISQIPEESSELLVIDWAANQENSSDTPLSPLHIENNVLTKKKESGSKKIANSRAKQSKKKVDPSSEAFRQSQRIIRKEAKKMCLKDMLSKTVISPPSIAEDSSSFFSSPTFNDCGWSPEIADDITSQFLSSVEENRKKRFEKFVSRDNGLSQMSVGSPVSDSFTCNGELVIYDEDANMVPPSEKLFSFLDDECEKELSNFIEVESTISKSSPVSYELDLVREKEKAAALSRKHRIWELQQRQRREEKILDLCKESLEQKSQPIAPSASNSVAHSHAGGAVDSFVPVPSLYVKRHPHDLSISESNLSTDDISMIQRINNFDKSGSHRLVLFSSPCGDNSQTS